MVDEYLTLAQHIKIIVISREPLNLDWEWIYQLEGMRFPENSDLPEIDSYNALKLMIERTKRHNRQFSLADELPCAIRLCELVGGMPLGIELAAAWLNRLNCKQLVDEIAKNIDILTNRDRNVPDRQRSIRAVFDYS